MNNKNLVYVDSPMLREIGESVIVKVKNHCYDPDVMYTLNTVYSVPKKWGGFLFPLHLKRFTKEEISSLYKEIVELCTNENLEHAAWKCYKDTRHLRKKSENIDVRVGLVKACRDIPHAGILVMWER